MNHHMNGDEPLHVHGNIVMVSEGLVDPLLTHLMILASYPPSEASAWAVCVFFAVPLGYRSITSP